MSDALLTANQLRKEFGGLIAVNNVDFTVPRGSIVSLIGPNGAGKTTFFNMLTRVYKPTSGQIVVDGEDDLAARGLVDAGQHVEERRLAGGVPPDQIGRAHV